MANEKAEHEVIVPSDRLSVRLVLHTSETPDSVLPHWHSSFEINCMLRWPESDVVVGNRSWRMQTGRIWLANSQEIHHEHPLVGDLNRLAVSVIYPYAYLRRIFPAIDEGRFELNDFESLSPSQVAVYYGKLTPRFARLSELLRGDDSPTRYIELSSIPLQLLQLLAESFFVPDAPAGHSRDHEAVERMHVIADYIGQNYTSDIHLEDIANLCHISRGFTARFMRERFGYSLGEYLGLVRAEHARQDLLARKGTQTQIAQLNGFSGIRSMNRQLELHYGQTAAQIVRDSSRT